MRSSCPIAGCRLSFVAVFVCLLLPARAAETVPLQSLHHTAWSAESGLGEVMDVQQAPDGFLWLTTSVGVFRFDGVRFETAAQATNGAVVDNDIFSVFVASDGGVWLSTRNAGFLLWKDRKLTVFKDRRCTPAGQVGGLVVEDAPNSLWVRATSGLSHLHNGVCEQPGKAQGYPGGQPAGLFADRSGNVWVKAPTGELLVQPHGQSRFRPSGYATPPSPSATNIRQANDGSLWLSDETGFYRLVPAGAANPAEVKPVRVFAADDRLAPRGDFIFSAGGALWITTADGVRRYGDALSWTLPATATAPHDDFTRKLGLSSNAVSRLLIDREGTVWAASTAGLDRLRRTPLQALVIPDAPQREYAVAAADDGAVWTGNSSLPLTRIAANGAVTTFPQTQHIVCLRRDRNGVLWAAGSGAGSLWALHGDRLETVHYPGEETLPVVSLAVDRNNDVWIMTRDGDTYKRTTGTWEKQNQAMGKRAALLGAMAGDAAGDIWFAFATQVVHWDGKAFHRYSLTDPKLNISTSTMFVRGGHVWFAGRGGIEVFANGTFHLLTFADHTLPGRVSGVVETAGGELWANTFSGALHVTARELQRFFASPGTAVAAEHFDALDGMPGLSGERLPEPSLVEGPTGQLWFATTRGLALLDPARLELLRNHVPPPLQITSVSSGATTVANPVDARLPAHSESLDIQYTALSLAMPERVTFRYKLEGYDREWVDAGQRREAFYTGVPPGHYTFRVLASNNSGIWSTTEAAVPLTIAPAFYQTWTFRGLCVLTGGVLLWWLMRLRVARILHQQQLRLDERTGERERIARELHDTLLQSLFGISLHFSEVLNRMPADDPNRETLAAALDKSDAIMKEGRNRVRDLRGHSDDTCAIASLKEYAEQLQGFGAAEFSAGSSGERRKLAPLVHEEMVMIFREALSNAFHHANARRIELHLCFHPRHLIVTLSDDGRGIDEALLKSGRENHWGLPGMRERARKLRGTLRIDSVVGSGTTIRLTVPAAAAYTGASGRDWWNMLWSGRPVAAQPEAHAASEPGIPAGS